MAKDALIIFVRKPELGKVKTRLAASVGEEAALAVYHLLLAHTHAVATPLTCCKIVFYSHQIETGDRWSGGYEKRVQATADLGGRMEAAFASLFAEGFDRVCIVGSDCFELTTAIITDAFEALNNVDVVVGPAKDGGYYLLGMKNHVKPLFTAIEWSTEKVFEQTVALLLQHHLTYKLLPVLRDVDTASDLPAAVAGSLGIKVTSTPG